MSSYTVVDTNVEEIYTKITLNPKEKVVIKKPTKGIKISQKEFNRIRKQAWSKI